MNHFESEQREFYKSEKKLRFYIDKGSKCFNVKFYYAAVAFAVAANLFMVRSILKKRRGSETKGEEKKNTNK